MGYQNEKRSRASLMLWLIIIVIKLSLSQCIDWIHNCDNIDARYPQVNVIAVSDSITYKQYPNQTNILDVLDSVPILILQCQASYPIQWVFTDHYPVTSDNLRNWHINSSRTIINIWNTSTYQFESNLTLFYRAPAEPRQQMCKYLIDKLIADNNEGYNSRLATKVSSAVHGKYLRLNISTTLFEAGSKSGTTLISRYGNEPNCTYTLEYYQDSNMICCSTGKDEYKFFSRGCSTPSNCQGFHKQSHCLVQHQKMNTSMTKGDVIDNCINGTNLASYGNSGVVVCGDSADNSDSIAIHYFTSVLDTCSYNFEGNKSGSLEKIPALYVNKDPAILKANMLKLCPSRHDILYVGEKVEFKCIGTYYYFSSGFHWMIKKTDSSGVVSNILLDHDIHSLETVSSSKFPPEKDIIKTIHESTVTIELNDSSIFEIDCLAPVWNTFEWVNKTQILNVIEPKAINFINETHEEFTLSQGTIISCSATGDPLPKLTWHDIPENVQIITNNALEIIKLNFSSLNLEEFVEGNEFKFYCTAQQERINRQSRKTFLLKRVPKQVFPMIEILAALTVVLLLGFLAFYGINWRRIKNFKNKTRNLNGPEIKEFFEGKQQQPSSSIEKKDVKAEVNAWEQKYDVSYELSPKEVEIGDEIAKGEFGMILFGKLKKPNSRTQFSEVVCKTCKPFSDIVKFKAFLYELKLRIFIGYHKNIVQLIGAQTSKIYRQEVFIILEYCKYHDLKKYLVNNRTMLIANFCGNRLWSKSYDSSRSSKSKIYVTTEEIMLGNLSSLRWIVDVLSALVFLGTKNIIHGDIAARNVLLDSILTAKICDFGMSHQLTGENYAYTVEDNLKVPCKWSPLECLEKCEYSIKSDVYSFGILLWEIYSLGEEPWIEYTNLEMRQVLRSGLTMDMPRFSTLQIYDKMKSCWNINRQLRPTFEELYEYFSGLLNKSTNLLNNR